MTLLPHGVESEGVATPADWRPILDRARKIGTLLGSDEERFPVDVDSLVRYHGELARIRHRFDLPEPLAVDDALGLVRVHGPHPASRSPTAPLSRGMDVLVTRAMRGPRARPRT